ncbi:MAG TPA: helix-turn-helix domain-containing protein [Magnetospirillaceae bacterium]|jgi:AraC-like DNA-binding protein
MATRGPHFEKIATPDQASWRLFDRRLEALPFLWHYHPEFELTLTLNSHGYRYVGDHIAPYDDGDLVLVGSNLPHTWHSQGRYDEAAPHRALVLWFTADWIARLTEACVELDGVEKMLAQAGRGIAFSRGTAQIACDCILSMIDGPPAARLTGLIDVLALLAADKKRAILAAPGLVAKDGAVSVPSGEGGRIDKILAAIHDGYRGELRVGALADLGAVSVSSFHRLFKHHTGVTFTDYVMRLRIGQACALLASGDKPVAWIAEEVGYRNLANFNRQFRALKGVTPRDFRKRFAA